MRVERSELVEFYCQLILAITSTVSSGDGFMSKDGTNRGGRRVRAGAKPDPLNEKLAAGRPATRLEEPLNEPFDFEGGDIGAGAVLAGETMPEPSDYLSEVQRDGKPLGADGPSPRIVDTVVVDYAAVGSVAARRAS